MSSPEIEQEEIKFKDFKPRKLILRIVPDTARKYDILLGRPLTETLDLLYS